MEKLWSVEAVADMFGVSQRTIRNYIKDGALKGSKIGGQWRFSETEINRFRFSSSYLWDWVNEEAVNFLDGVADYDGAMQICTIVDLVVDENQTQEMIIERIKKLTVLEDNQLIRVRSQIVPASGKRKTIRRSVLFGEAEYIKEAIDILKG